MSDITEPVHLPSELHQFNNYFKGKEKLNFAVESTTLTAIIRGLLTIIPSELEQAHTLEKPQLLTVVSSLLAYELALNDYWDFSLSGRNDISELIDESAKKVEKTKRNLFDQLQFYPNKAEAVLIEMHINTLVQETSRIEESIRLKAKEKELSLEDALTYRRVVNAIANAVITNLLTGGQFLAARLPLKEVKTNWNDIVSKYSWIFSENPHNNVELAVMVMDRIATAGQIDDDWFGRHIDELLNIPSISYAAHLDPVAETNPRKKLSALRQQYLSEAKQLGMGRIPTEVVALGFKEMQRMNRVITRFMRQRHQNPLLGALRNRIVSRFMPRETAYMEGHLS